MYHSYKNQSTDLQYQLINWFQNDGNIDLKWVYSFIHNIEQ